MAPRYPSRASRSGSHARPEQGRPSAHGLSASHAYDWAVPGRCSCRNLDARQHHGPADALAWSDARTAGDRPRQDPKVLPDSGPSPPARLGPDRSQRPRRLGNHLRAPSPVAVEPVRMVQGARRATPLQRQHPRMEPVLGRSQWPLAPLRRSPARPRRPGTPGDRIRPNRHLLGLATISHVAERDPQGARSAMGLTGANCGSQRAQTRPGPPRRLRNVTAGERLAVRPPQTRPDTGFVPGGQGVAGSNPAVPTKRSRSEGVPGSYRCPFSIFGSQPGSGGTVVTMVWLLIV